MAKDEDFLIKPTETIDDAVDSLSGVSVNNLSDLEKMVDQIINSLPKLDKNKIRQEMENMTVDTYQSPTTFDVNAGLASAQGYRDRLTEIYTIALNEYKVRKRCVDMLFDANNLLSKASSADKRKGEATMRYPIHLLQLEISENFMKEVEQMLANMKSISETISRQVSVISAQISLGEYVKRASKIGNGEAEEELDYHSQVPKVNVEWENIK